MHPMLNPAPTDTMHIRCEWRWCDCARHYTLQVTDDFAQKRASRVVGPNGPVCWAVLAPCVGPCWSSVLGRWPIDLGPVAGPLTLGPSTLGPSLAPCPWPPH
jgi:hypothetical protein